jgi:metal-responsive CopG/Arc/MetJ family transcriptional regulator
MVRTQIYLTEQERRGLDRVVADTGKKQSELIREAIDRFLEQMSSGWRNTVLKEAAGLWRNREDLPDFETERRSWDRG